MQRLSVSPQSSRYTAYAADGSGPLVSGGFELHPGLGVDLALWVDLTYAKASLSGEHLMSDASAHFFTAGVSVGF
jgi:hypothetical protein